MYKKILSVFVFLLFFSIGFVLAAQGNGNGTGNGTGADSGNSSQNGNGTSLQDQNQNAGDTQQNMEQNRVRVQNGEHVGENGKMFQVQTRANNRIQIKAGEVSAECSCNMTQEKIQNKTKLHTQLSNGKNAEIKVMPDTASETALNRLRLKVCSEENGCQIELKEVGTGEQTKLAYELKTQRQSRVFGLFKAKMQVQAEVNAENGEIIRVKKPWWAFLASEPAEE